MSALELFWLGWVLAALVMAAMWGWQRRTHNASLVDVAWAGGVGALALVYALLADGDGLRRLLAALLAGLWSARLAWHIHGRVAGREEDPRYQYLRGHWREYTQLKFFVFYQAQALGVLLFALPLLVVVTTPSPLPGWAAVLALLVWVVAVGGESLADRQLAAWKADPHNQGKTCRAGLWRYSRHPNYFFEWLHWFCYPLLAVGADYGWLTLVGPLLMLWLLFKVTGIPQTERHALESRGEDYRAYQRSTSVFVPWFPDLEKER